jgi:hypothetical protein
MGDFPLDLLSPVRHVATELDRVSPEALSISQMAATYQHPNTGDLARVKRQHRYTGNGEAQIWLIGQAVKELGEQIASDGNGGFLLVREFDRLRYKRQKLIRLVDIDAQDEKRALRAAYNDLREQRKFRVAIEGPQGGMSEKRFELHPLARAIPQMSEQEFLDTAADIKTNGVELPIIVYNGQVLDGRHRLAIASTLGLPVKVTEVDGDDARARARVMSLNVTRRMLTSAQRALIVRQLFLPEAKEKAKDRRSGKIQDQSVSAELRERNDHVKATEDAVKESGQLANVRSVEALAPIDNAPETQERIHRGEIKTVAEARREAEKEQGIESTKPPVAQPRSAWDRLGCALGDVKSAADSIESGFTGNVSTEKIRERINEIREHLDRAEALAKEREQHG